jgi:N6-adenosine-specific RNA methylase IME4
MKSTALVIIKPIKPPENLKAAGAQLMKAKTPEQVLAFDANAAGWEAYMRKAGFSQGDMHTINEHRMRARWRLGQMLAAVERQKRGKKGVRPVHAFLDMLKRLQLQRPRAIEAQRIAELPKLELEKIFQEARRIGELVTITWLIDAASPYWYKASRKKKHVKIAEMAATQAIQEIKQFPLLYVDPPTKFDVYSEKGLGRTADQHYPTMTDEEIIDYVKPFVPDTGAVLWWCTSSNQPRAEAMLDALGYEFKSSAVWVKTAQPFDDEPLTRVGLGLVFRNMHEVLLYGTRGNMPGPQYQPPSVFFYPRGRHSAKPPEIRAEIEKMYPDFDASTRLELFAREQVPGWTTFGYEANSNSSTEIITKKEQAT